MKKILIAILPLLLLASPAANAQKKSKAPVEPVEQPQNPYCPSIMVIPYVTGDEDLRTVLETDVNKRIVLNKIRECFDVMGYTTIDFVARLKAISNNPTFTEGNQTDFKNTLIESSGADIYVEAEMVIRANNVKVILTGYDTATGASLSNTVGESGTFPGMNDIGKLAQTAIENCSRGFLGTLQTKFAGIAEDGRSIVLNIGLDEESALTMESEVGTEGLQLSDEIELWIEDHAHKGIFHIQGTTPTQMIVDDLRIPVYDAETGKPYNASRFGMDFFRFMRSLGINISRNLKGNTLYIKIR